MNLRWHTHAGGQSILEYAVLIAVAAAAVVAMSTYVQRAVQAHVKNVEQELNAAKSEGGFSGVIGDPGDGGGGGGGGGGDGGGGGGGGHGSSPGHEHDHGDDGDDHNGDDGGAVGGGAVDHQPGGTW